VGLLEASGRWKRGVQVGSVKMREMEGLAGSVAGSRDGEKIVF
jgi:hypothetical protein